MRTVSIMGPAGAREDGSRDDHHRDAGPGVSLLTSVAHWGDPRLRSEWGRILDADDDRQALFQSPEWFDHIVATEPDADLALACVRDGDGSLIGLVPLARACHELEYSIKKFRLGKSSLSLLQIPGGVPPLPQDVTVYDRIFELLRQAAHDHDGLFLRMVPTSSFCWRYLNESPLVRASFALSVPEGLGHNNAVALPPTFKEYLGHFKSKTRYNLRQRVKQLREWGGGELTLRRFEASDEIGTFLELAAAVARRSWQAGCTDDRVDTTPYWGKKLTDLADRGLLRAYILSAGGRPCAFALGYQGRGTFHHIQTGYDPSLAARSPGSVLHFLLFEDLILHRPPRRTSFGFGDSEYKRTFGNLRFEEASVLLVNHRMSSKLKAGSYTTFRSMVRFARRLSRAASTRGTPSGVGASSGVAE